MKSNAAYLSEHPLPVEPMSIDTTSSQTIAKPIVSRSFILQTASDYAMEEYEVEIIFNLHPGYNFYVELEKFIELRSQNCG